MNRRLVPPSGLPLARTARRRVAGTNGPRPRRRPVQRDVSTSSDHDDDRADRSPYDDPSRDLGEGPDELAPIQRKVLLFGLLLLIFLLFATCGPREPAPPLEHRCHVCAELTTRDLK